MLYKNAKKKYLKNRRQKETLFLKIQKNIFFLSKSISHNFVLYVYSKAQKCFFFISINYDLGQNAGQLNVFSASNSLNVFSVATFSQLQI